MKVMDMVRNMGARIRYERDRRDAMDDNVTQDRQLRSLRREKRILMEEHEKKRLMQEIGEMKRARTRRNVFGVRDHDDPFDKHEHDHRLLKSKSKVQGKQASGLLGKYKMNGGGLL
jgi:hypothetical protein